MASQFLDLLAAARSRLRPPVLIVLGAPRLSADLVTALGLPETTCYQMDLHQSARLRDELLEIGDDAVIQVKPDLWDLPAEFNTVLLPAPARGERELKLDMVEQAYHVLRPRGMLVVLSPVPKDQFFPAAMKKVFGKVALETSRDGTVLWSPRGADQPRRRHEVSFHVRKVPPSPGFAGEGLGVRADFEAPSPPTPLPQSRERGEDRAFRAFLSRPGVFTYGRMDDGARALNEVAEVRPGDAIIDIGCGTGAVGVLAALRAGPGASVTFVDSNVRATAVAEINARNNGLTDFRVIANARLEVSPPGQFDLALANPPYYSQQSIARLFIEGAKRLLRPGGRLYLVTKQADVVGKIMQEQLGETRVVMRRDYAVLLAKKN